MRSALLIQRWYRQYVARLEMRRRCTWNIFQSIEYAGQQDQIKLYNFFGFLMDHFTPASSERNLISHIFRENEVFQDVEWEPYFCYKSIEVPDTYAGPHLTFPLTVSNITELVEAFKHKEQLHARFVLQLLGETWRLLRVLPNITEVSTCHSKEITICGDLHGHLEDLLLVFYKNGLPSVETPYVFNGDFVDRGKDSIEILLILFAFQLVYPNDVHLNRGNHEDHIVNLRYGFTKEVLGKYRLHGKKILKLLQKIFSWLPLATVIDQKVLILHGGISDTTDLKLIAKLERNRSKGPGGQYSDGEGDRYSAAGRRRVRSLTHSNPATARHELQRRSLQAYSIRTSPNVEEELRERRRWAGLSASYERIHDPISSDSDPDSGEVLETDAEEWKQIVDMLWSDPMLQDGCIPNEVRGGGCYWGPDVTQEVLNRHNLCLLIRSHECKQDGYEFCHNRKVLTIFSASNYYEVGSNRGYQASRSTRELTLRQSLPPVFISGVISMERWAVATETVLHLGLPWRVLRSQLLNSFCLHSHQLAHTGLLETMYRHHSNLETIFRIIDTDHSGLISFEEFRQTWKLLSSHLKMEISDKAISDLALSIDFNKDGSIDINEFMEAFRLVDCSHAQILDSINEGLTPDLQQPTSPS
uniref:Serine/threonine-protein phosphatase with EF-hands n=1 Tax=Pygocentrus nattereri TaxID=42514 RepID=A0AAR2KFB7_PYGNA